MVPAALSMGCSSCAGQAPGGIAVDHLAFELELHDRGGLLHPRHHDGIAQAGALRHETGRRIVGVDIANQVLQAAAA